MPGRADAVALARLIPLLTGYGLTVDLVEHHQQRSMLVVTNPVAEAVAGPRATIYLADHPGWAELAVYGFTNLYLGSLKQPERVAARLAWLLGVPNQPAAHPPT